MAENVIVEVVLHLSFHLYTTISPENNVMLTSTKAVIDVKIVRTLKNGYYNIECTPQYYFGYLFKLPIVL